jgi:peptidoglycan/LPS O-acetylase OafA/YrhL
MPGPIQPTFPGEEAGEGAVPRQNHSRSLKFKPTSFYDRLMSALRVESAISKRFRPEIEGLRAVAVVAVVLFHVGFGFISGGFLGVDIFFVISGFLITRNIITEVEGGEFRLSRFYWRRILRLFPASATTIFVTLLAGFVLLPPDEVIQLVHSAIAAIFAVSNVYFLDACRVF